MPKVSKRTKYLGLIGVLVVGLLFLMHKRGEIYNYDVNADYRYTFGAATGQSAKVEIANGKFTMPFDTRESDASFLKVTVHARLLGNYLNPQVTATAGGRTVAATFEQGADGVRYINLSPLKLAKGDIVALAGRHMDVVSESTTVHVLPKRWEKPDPVVLVLAPHPDDAEIAAFGLYSHSNAYVVTLTAGEAGDERFFRIFGDTGESFLEKGRVRVWNSVTVPQLGDVPADHAANLGYFDGTLRTMHDSPTTPVTSRRAGVSPRAAFRAPVGSPLLAPRESNSATWANLVKDLEFVISTVKPDLIVTPYPAIDNHPDHQYTTVAIIEALRNLQVHAGYLLLYSNHNPLSYMYPYGDQGEAVSLPPRGAPIYFDGIYSRDMTASEQRRKLIALDAMTDLRVDTDWGSISQTSAIVVQNLRVAVTGTENSYVRRSVRANELFFVVDVAHLGDDHVVAALSPP